MVDVADDVDAGDYFEDADAAGDTVDAADDYYNNDVSSLFSFGISILAS